MKAVAMILALVASYAHVALAQDKGDDKRPVVTEMDKLRIDDESVRDSEFLSGRRMRFVELKNRDADTYFYNRQVPNLFGADYRETVKLAKALPKEKQKVLAEEILKITESPIYKLHTLDSSLMLQTSAYLKNVVNVLSFETKTGAFIFTKSSISDEYLSRKGDVKSLRSLNHALAYYTVDLHEGKLTGRAAYKDAEVRSFAHDRGLTEQQAKDLVARLESNTCSLSDTSNSVLLSGHEDSAALLSDVKGGTKVAGGCSACSLVLENPK